MAKSVYQLKCSCNNYPWGKTGSDSLAARLCAETPGTDFKIDESKDYAEMWMGTYPELPSYVLETGENLQDVIDANAEQLIGKAVLEKFGHSDLPFLPKVLSIAKALPLQLHPNKELAAKLHEKDPSNFTDPNHKPEIALALGPFEAFCGFKPLASIYRLLELEPLQQFLPKNKESSFTDKSLKAVVKAMLEASDEVVAKTNNSLQRLPIEAFGDDQYILDLLPRLSEQYDKSDNGTLVALITMNYMQLNKGDSIYIPADGIHAYLSGDIIECMARSNNVLNTGFCPRAERNSIDMFTSVLTFTPHNIEEALLKPEQFALSTSKGKTLLYAPPMSEFNMISTELVEGEKETIEKIAGPSILIVTQGKGEMKVGEESFTLAEGFVFFIGQGVETSFQASGHLQMFRAFVE
ncbi:mannose-6-phosphate isomerase [Tothia fuscella]|uniref:Mannose-6-phosphate isomerase n=1 Tax=Tothia fuscella TaxID=1048955 RepID=A0A9P4TXJ3_9PEZI|nr:mannose-6-phosphate isomerase [Tothia fuscella]